jgi:hypothetical protein
MRYIFCIIMVFNCVAQEDSEKENRLSQIEILMYKKYDYVRCKESCDEYIRIYGIDRAVEVYKEFCEEMILPSDMPKDKNPAVPKKKVPKI